MLVTVWEFCHTSVCVTGARKWVTKVRRGGDAGQSPGGRATGVRAAADTNRDLLERAVESPLESPSPAGITLATYSGHVSAHFQEWDFHFSKSFFLGSISVVLCSVFFVFFPHKIYLIFKGFLSKKEKKIARDFPYSPCYTQQNCQEKRQTLLHESQGTTFTAWSWHRPSAPNMCS